MSIARRLAAILAADVVGYSRLMGEDEAGTAQAVREHRAANAVLVAERGGRLVKTIGDGVLIEFPSVVAAVECAILVQKQMAERNASVPETKRIVYRIGVNLGDVLIDGDDILGDGVNVAARLEGIAEPGGLCLSASAYEQVRGRVDACFIDLGEKMLKNIAQPVRVYAWPGAAKVAQIASASPTGATRSPRKRGRHAALAALALTAIAAMAWLAAPWRAWDPTRRMTNALDNAAPPRLSLVVLPFANLSDDPAQDYFADGVTDDLTTDVAQLPGSFVIAHNTAATYKGKAVDIGRIARELNVRYAVEGSVRRIGDEVRVNVQLIDAQSGAHVWADRFEYPVSDLAALQDQVTARLANELGVELVNAEAARGQPRASANADAVDLRLKGWAELNRGYVRENIESAVRLFDQALAIDPNNTEALVGLGTAIGFLVYFQWNVQPRERELARGLQAVDKALTQVPNNASAHTAKGELLTDAARHEEALPEYDAAIAFNPNLSAAYGFRGMTRFFAGRPEETFADEQTAIGLSPKDPLLSTWYRIGCAAAAILGRADSAIEWCRKSEALEQNWITLANLTAAYGLAGRTDEAEATRQALLKLRPDFTLEKALSRQKLITQNARYFSLYEKNYLEGLRRAGLPER